MTKVTSVSLKIRKNKIDKQSCLRSGRSGTRTLDRPVMSRML